MMSLLKKNMVPIGVVIVLVGAVYYFMSSGDQAPLLSTTQESPVSQEILTTLGNLRTIKLDDSVFKDPLFMSLSDFGVTIPPAAAGRRNPFAPVGQGSATSVGSAGAGAAASATTTAKTATTTPAH